MVLWCGVCIRVLKKRCMSWILVKREACLLYVPHTHWTEGVRNYFFPFSFFGYVYMHRQTDCAERGLVVKRGIERG